MTRSTRTLLWHSVLAAIFSLAGAGLLLALFRLGFVWYWLLAAWLISVNLTTFGYYAYDKSQARAQPQGERIPELVLHGLAGLGGTLGAYIGMVVLRHKTIKPAFRIVFWLTVAFQALLVVALVYRIARGAD